MRESRASEEERRRVAEERERRDLQRAVEMSEAADEHSRENEDEDEMVLSVLRMSLQHEEERNRIEAAAMGTRDSGRV